PRVLLILRPAAQCRLMAPNRRRYRNQPAAGRPSVGGLRQPHRHDDQSLDAKSAVKTPVLDALKTYPKEIALASGSFVATTATFYFVSVWLISSATTNLGSGRTALLTANAVLSLSDIPMILAFGLLSDYVGRRKIFLTGMAVLALFAIPYF